MTTEQKSQFNRYGCLTCCLIKMADLAGNKISRQDFCDRFGHLFYDPENRYGYLDIDQLASVARDLALPGAFGYPPTGYKLVQAYAECLAYSIHGVMVLVKSEVNLSGGASELQRHCSLLHLIDDRSFTLWTVSTDGKERSLPFPVSAWAEKRCAGIVFI
jgi:hypothetical protein